MPNSLSVYTTNSNKIKNKNKIRNKNKNSDKLKIDAIASVELEPQPITLEPIPINLELEYTANCLICLEPTQETNKLFKMKDIVLINSHCECNGNLHMNCLTDWISVSKTCPYCRGALTINLEILRQVDTFNSSALTVKLTLFTRRLVRLFYAIVMMMTKYIALLFLLNTLLRVAIDIYIMIDKRQ
jgi:hypothetical protein